MSSKAVFRFVHDPTKRREVGMLDDGPPGVVRPQHSTLTFLWAAQRNKGPDVQYNHLWGDPRNPNMDTALLNLCATLASLAKTTNGPNHPEVVNLLRYRA